MADPGFIGKADDEEKLVRQLARGRNRLNVVDTICTQETGGVTMALSPLAKDAAMSPRRLMVDQAEQFYQIGNYHQAEKLFTKAVGEGPTFELLKKRATAREQLGEGWAAADSGAEYCTLGEGWTGVGEHSRAAEYFQLATECRGVSALEREK